MWTLLLMLLIIIISYNADVVDIVVDERDRVVSV